MDIINNVKELEECVLFGFLFNSEKLEVISYCTLYTKYYIYIEKLKEKNNWFICMSSKNKICSRN